jgi:multidrug efflux pump subunit AcrA (membrane-fusion protein)
MSEQSSPGRESLVYQPSKVSWATAEFIRKPPNWLSRAFLYFLLFAVVVAAVYSYFARIAISIQTPGILVSEQSLIPVQAPVGFRVAKLYVSENQFVPKGAVLLVSEEQLGDEEYVSIVSEVKELSALLERMKKGPCPSCVARLRALGEKAFAVQNKGSIRETLAPVQNLLRDLASLEEQFAGIDEAMMVQHRQIRLAEEKLREIRKRHAEQILAMQVEQLTGEIISAKAQIADRKQGISNQIDQVRNKLEVQMANLEPAVKLYRSQQWLTAPLDATVTQLKVSGVGQLVSPGQEIMQLVPLETRLEAELLVANRDISQVKPKMEVKINLDALPERDYGTVPGTIRTVPVNVSESREAQSQATYRVRVALGRQSVVKKKTEYPFRLGMTLTGLIITDRKSLLEVGIRKLLNIKDDLFKG